MQSKHLITLVILVFWFDQNQARLLSMYSNFLLHKYDKFDHLKNDLDKDIQRPEEIKPTLNEAKETSYVKKLNDFMKPRNLMRSEIVENMLETNINSNENKILARHNPLAIVIKMKKPEMEDLKNIYLKNISQQPTSRDFKRRQFFKKKPYHRAYYLRT